MYKTNTRHNIYNIHGMNSETLCLRI